MINNIGLTASIPNAIDNITNTTQNSKNSIHNVIIFIPPLKLFIYFIIGEEEKAKKEAKIFLTPLDLFSVMSTSKILYQNYCYSRHYQNDPKCYHILVLLKSYPFSSCHTIHKEYCETYFKANVSSE